MFGNSKTPRCLIIFVIGKIISSAKAYASRMGKMLSKSVLWISGQVRTSMKAHWLVRSRFFAVAWLGKKRKWQVKDGKCGYLVEPTMQYSRLACPQQISESRQRLEVPSCNKFFFCPACNRHLMQMLRTKEPTIDIQLNYASFTIRGHLRKT